MAEVQRYDLGQRDFGDYARTCWDILPKKDGRYVTFEQYDTLRKLCSELAAMVADLRIGDSDRCRVCCHEDEYTHEPDCKSESLLTRAQEVLNG